MGQTIVVGRLSSSRHLLQEDRVEKQGPGLCAARFARRTSDKTAGVTDSRFFMKFRGRNAHPNRVENAPPSRLSRAVNRAYFHPVLGGGPPLIDRVEKPGPGAGGQGPGARGRGPGAGGQGPGARGRGRAAARFARRTGGKTAGVSSPVFHEISRAERASQQG
ncbi:hypothetical protein SBA3_2060014 [Candidatus Sulfopaludibacter sp. SbA3]|nr:hypothetical protein SBA3_2060014 [Candidatus Sulfopaludibacter sp. SbA3]